MQNSLAAAGLFAFVGRCLGAAVLIMRLCGGSKPPPYDGGSICKELSRPIYILDSINLNLTKEGIIYEKILVAFLFVLIGFYTPSFIDAFQLDGSVFELVMFAPYVGIPLAVWGMFEKK